MPSNISQQLLCTAVPLSDSDTRTKRMPLAQQKAVEVDGCALSGSPAFVLADFEVNTGTLRCDAILVLRYASAGEEFANSRRALRRQPAKGLVRCQARVRLPRTVHLARRVPLDDTRWRNHNQVDFGPLAEIYGCARLVVRIDVLCVSPSAKREKDNCDQQHSWCHSGQFQTRSSYTVQRTTKR